MVRSIGLDIVDTERIAGSLEQFGDRFPERILGPRELELYRDRPDKVQFLAGRFAAKEAFIKCMAGILSLRPPWTQVQVLADADNRPVYVLDESLKKVLSGIDVLLSISHERGVAAAVAVVTISSSGGSDSSAIS